MRRACHGPARARQRPVRGVGRPDGREPEVSSLPPLGPVAGEERLRLGEPSVVQGAVRRCARSTHATDPRGRSRRPLGHGARGAEAAREVAARPGDGRAPGTPRSAPSPRPGEITRSPRGGLEGASSCARSTGARAHATGTGALRGSRMRSASSVRVSPSSAREVREPWRFAPRGPLRRRRGAPDCGVALGPDVRRLRVRVSLATASRFDGTPGRRRCPGWEGRSDRGWQGREGVRARVRHGARPPRSSGPKTGLRDPIPRRGRGCRRRAPGGCSKRRVGVGTAAPCGPPMTRRNPAGSCLGAVREGPSASWTVLRVARACR